eukprot:1161742-Pelagomonas_calceolata.AAC.1
MLLRSSPHTTYLICVLPHPLPWHAESSACCYMMPCSSSLAPTPLTSFVFCLIPYPGFTDPEKVAQKS